MQEVRNAVDQANREAATRFDFKSTDSAIELSDTELVLRSSTEDRLRALHQVLDEKLVRRQVSLKAFEDGKIEEAAKGRPARRSPSGPASPRTTPSGSTSSSRTSGLKGVSSQTQGDQLRVTGKKRDDLQAVIAKPARRRTSASRCSSTTSGTEPRPRRRSAGGRGRAVAARSSSCSPAATFSAWCSSYSTGSTWKSLLKITNFTTQRMAKLSRLARFTRSAVAAVAQAVVTGEVAGQPDGRGSRRPIRRRTGSRRAPPPSRSATCRSCPRPSGG